MWSYYIGKDRTKSLPERGKMVMIVVGGAFL